MSKAERLADDYADACFEQGLHQRIPDDDPTKKRRALMAELRCIYAINTELLEALKFMLDSEVNGWDVLPAQDMARAAIAKAEAH